MASKTSRWATSTPDDLAHEAKRKREKEEKRQKKQAEKARKQAEEAKRRAQQSPEQQDEEEGGGGRPAKRRRTTPPADKPLALLRYQAPPVAAVGDVDKYEKLNDIEEGAYGWVARARETATGKVVALKRLKVDPADRGGLPVTGLREIQILKDCSHRNVVRLVEVVTGRKVGGGER